MILATNDSNHYRYRVEEDQPENIESYLKKQGFSNRLISSIKRKGLLTRNYKPVRFVDATKVGDIIDIYLPQEHLDLEPAEDWELDIIYEDDEILVVNKPAYVVMHPTNEYQEFTLANYVASHYKKTNQDIKVRFVNRLDRDTTGIIVIAKNKFVHHYIQSRMTEGDVKKIYLAVAEGEPDSENGSIDLPIYRPDSESIERVVDERGQRSITDYQLLEKFNDASLLECKLKTGRTHQIRVHLKAIGSPIVGDPLYNEDSIEKFDFHRQALHAYRMQLYTPLSGKLVFEAPIPEDMMELCSRMRRNS